MQDLPHRVAIAVGFLVSLLAYSRLPGPVLTGPFLIIHGAAVAPRPFVAFTLPAAALVIYVIFSRLRRSEDATDAPDQSAASTYRSITLVVVLFVVTLQMLLLAGSSGALWMRPWAARAVVVLFGLLLIGAGNLLPRTRPNPAFGIRTRRTLSDRSLWIHVNRVGGYVAVGLGLVIVLAGAFLTKPTMPAVVNAAVLAGFVMLLVSYRRHGRA